MSDPLLFVHHTTSDSGPQSPLRVFLSAVVISVIVGVVLIAAIFGIIFLAIRLLLHNNTSPTMKRTFNSLQNMDMDTVQGVNNMRTLDDLQDLDGLGQLAIKQPHDCKPSSSSLLYRQNDAYGSMCTRDDTDNISRLHFQLPAVGTWAHVDMARDVLKERNACESCGQMQCDESCLEVSPHSFGRRVQVFGKFSGSLQSFANIERDSCASPPSRAESTNSLDAEHERDVKDGRYNEAKEDESAKKRADVELIMAQLYLG